MREKLGFVSEKVEKAGRIWKEGDFIGELRNWEVFIWQVCLFRFVNCDEDICRERKKRERRICIVFVEGCEGYMVREVG